MEEQQKFMEEEYVIIVDTDDKVIGKDTKLATHKTKTIAEGLLHRAFSVILFNSKNELLLQQRAGCKITFPYFWANTCCSHPLHVESELIEENALGVKNAAVRKVDHELGITDLKVEDLTFTTKLQYQAAQDAEWAEHEIDWLLIAKRDVVVNPNVNEVEAVRFVSKEDLIQLLADADAGKVKVAAWFHLMSQKFLIPWWDRIDEIRALDRLPDDLAEGLPPVTYLGTPGTAKPAKFFYPDAVEIVADKQ